MSAAAGMTRNDMQMQGTQSPCNAKLQARSSRQVESHRQLDMQALDYDWTGLTKYRWQI